MVTETILLPATREEVVDQLNTLGTMTTSTEWERSALVYALTADGRTIRNSRNREIGKVSFQELASWGIVGLTSHNTVAAYHKYWAEAMGQGLSQDAVLGGEYIQPAKEWPGFPKVPDTDDEPEADTPFTMASNIIAAATKTILKVMDVHGLDADDLADLEEPLSNGLEAAIADVREWIAAE